MADLAQLTTWLTEAEAARHDLMLGKSVVTVARDGRRLEYNRTDLAKLDAYIQNLRGQIDAINAGETADGTPRRRRAIGVAF